MTPQPKRKGHVLTSLVVQEVSLVDRPSCAEHGIPRATVALYKRDSSGPSDLAARRSLQNRVLAFDGELHDIKKRLAGSREQPHEKFRREKPMGQFKKILKNATRNRETVVSAVIAKAEKIAAKRGISLEAAEAQVWKKRPDAQASYEAARQAPAKPVERVASVTKAEAELDSRARTIMKRDGSTYALACRKVLEDDPGLYKQYEAELAAGSTYSVPAPAEYFDPAAKRGKSDDTTCPKCGGGVDEDAAYCATCGNKLT
jgi:hypothetical protein